MHLYQIDLDTIDLSNLNRQFLFNKSHIKKSKALVASAVASSFNPSIQIKPQHANIKEPQFGYEFFQTFDVVLNALDNLDARRWVNRMCIATNVPLVESGTTGFLGQVQPILKVSLDSQRSIVFCDVADGVPNVRLCLSGSHGLLRLHGEADAEDVPGMYHSLHSNDTYPLCRMGEDMAFQSTLRRGR